MNRALLILLLVRPAAVVLARTPEPPPSLEAPASQGPESYEDGFNDGLDGQAFPAGESLSAALGVPVMKLAYRLDRAFSPHKPLTRAADRVDKRPLREQAKAMSQDLRDDFLLDDDRLYLYQLPMSMGDMAIWQGCYTAMEVLRYQRTRDPVSRRYAEKAFDGLALFYRPGLPLIRGLLPVGFKSSNADSAYFHIHGDVQWMDDASVDQASGWLFGVLMAEQRLPSRTEAARSLLRAFTNDLIANRFHLKNGDGTLTRFGNLGQGILSPPPGVLLSFAALNQASQDTGRARYEDDLEALTRRHQDLWGSFASAPAFQWTHFYNHNIGFLALACALITERDPDRWDRFARGIIRLAEGVADPEGNSFWLYLSYWAIDQNPDLRAMNSGDRVLNRWDEERPRLLAQAKKSMYEFDFPRSKLAFETLNSRRKDLRFVHWPFSREKTVQQPLAVWQRPPVEFVWQRDPYQLDNWRGRRTQPAFRFNGMDFLLAYELGLATGGIAPGE